MGKRCPEQYEVDGFTMIAREAPLYNNKNKYYAHPLLCDKFLYLLPFRSPVERMLSWMSADTTFGVKGFSEIEGSESHFVSTHQVDHSKRKGLIAAFLPYNFFANLYDVNQEDWTTLKVDENKFVRIGGRNQWLRGYLSNAMTKWLGYEWDKDPSSINSANIPESLGVDVRDINANDIHFYNALRLLLEIDYVAPFASYPDDNSASKACKYEPELENVQEGSDIIEIVSDDKNGIWNILARAMNRHYNIDNNLFKWEGRRSKQGSTTTLADKISESDWKIIYDMNYYDFRLYSLAKYITKVDSEYHANFLENL